MYTLAQAPTLQLLGIDRDKASIPIGEILSGGPPPQGIPALGFGGDYLEKVTASPAPKFEAQQDIGWLADVEPVILVSIAGESRIYPLQILTWHEIVNDTLADTPIAVTFCPLCNSALAFDRRVPLSELVLPDLEAQNPAVVIEKPDKASSSIFAEELGENAISGGLLEVSFGVSGLLYQSNMLMFDSASSTLWSQLLGEAVVGSLTGTRLLRYPAPILSYAEAKANFPDALVLSRDTGFNRSYGRNPYPGYDDVESPAFLFNGVVDGRLPPKERVITLELEGEAVAYPFFQLQELMVLEDTVGDKPIVVFWQVGTASALNASDIASSSDIGSANVFSRQLGDRLLSFYWDGGRFVDKETGSSWSLTGQALSGELKGSSLSPILHDNTLWFAWAAFKPETRIYGPTE